MDQHEQVDVIGRLDRFAPPQDCESITNAPVDNSEPLSVLRCMMSGTTKIEGDDMCVICDGKSIAQAKTEMRARISQFGWTAQLVEGEHPHPEFGYTVGFTRHHLPEFIVIGLPYLRAYRVLSNLAESVRAGTRYSAGDVIQLAGLNLVLVEVVECEPWLIWASDLYGAQKVHALQAVWADPQGLMPWQHSYPSSETQPLLGVPVM